MGETVFVDFTGHEPLLSAEEVGRRLGRSLRWVEERCREGLPCHRIGSRRMFRLTEVRNWLGGEAA